MADNGRENDALILALARGLIIRAAAEATEVGERTVYRRLADPQFRRRISEVRGDLMDAAAGRLADGATEAADTLRELVMNADGDGTRLAAARELLRQATALRQTGELEERITRLEQAEVSDGDNTTTHRIA